MVTFKHDLRSFVSSACGARFSAVAFVKNLIDEWCPHKAPLPSQASACAGRTGDRVHVTAEILAPAVAAALLAALVIWLIFMRARVKPPRAKPALSKSPPPTMTPAQPSPRVHGSASNAATACSSVVHDSGICVVRTTTGQLARHRTSYNITVKTQVCERCVFGYRSAWCIRSLKLCGHRGFGMCLSTACVTCCPMQCSHQGQRADRARASLAGGSMQSCKSVFSSHTERSTVHHPLQSGWQQLQLKCACWHKLRF